MTVTLEQIRVAIRDRMQTVANVGVIHGYERYAKVEADFAALYTVSTGNVKSDLRGWFIRRVTTRDYEYLRTHTRTEIDWQVRGFMALVDKNASEIAMDDLIEKMRAAFARDLTLGGLVEDQRAEGQPRGLQLAESGPFMFAGYLCHGVRLDLMTTHFAALDAPADALGNFETFHANWDVPTHGNVEPPLPADATADATDHVKMETA